MVLVQDGSGSSGSSGSFESGANQFGSTGSVLVDGLPDSLHHFIIVLRVIRMVPLFLFVSLLLRHNTTSNE